MNKTGWPPPPLMQDDSRELSKWFASRPNARAEARAAVASLTGHEMWLKERFFFQGKEIFYNDSFLG